MDLIDLAIGLLIVSLGVLGVAGLLWWQEKKAEDWKAEGGMKAQR